MPAHPLTPRQLVSLEEARLADVMSSFADHVAQIAGVCCTYHRPGSWLNEAVNLPFDHPLTDEDIAAIDAFYRSHDAPPRLVASTYTHPDMLLAAARAGLHLTTVEHTLVIALPAPHDAPPSQISIEIIDPHDHDACEDYIRLHLDTFFPDDPNRDDHAEIARRVLHHPRSTILRARQHDTTLAVAGLERIGPLATLFLASTHPEHRGRGLQRALLQERLRRAASLGCSYATIGSLPGHTTERNALRAGFSPSTLASP